ncbi:GNAT family N-acetyltransferase [Roseivirga misakiensis]|uniref:N-acetyltransferase domain-containing protein n=1 Tax=Roseivirga misakiensis TaxID=1563681 RepID=A0A1E5T0W2_9BACT|nr:GNAT family N-acetyltransferase [Roseivirga misakiensis]OEK05001.1 hypothetical protein BFP71_16380 [Roseivirga misakiensis]
MKVTKLTKASSKDAFLLSGIAQKAKAHWGYPAEWLELWKPDLTFDQDYLNSHNTYTISEDGTSTPLGFCIVIEEGNHFQIEHCWVNQSQIGKGLGKKLMEEVLKKEPYLNHEFQVLSDPNAVGFYEKFGFQVKQMIPGVPEGRELPLMVMTNHST